MSQKNTISDLFLFFHKEIRFRLMQVPFIPSLLPLLRYQKINVDFSNGICLTFDKSKTLKSFYFLKIFLNIITFMTIFIDCFIIIVFFIKKQFYFSLLIFLILLLLLFFYYIIYYIIKNYEVKFKNVLILSRKTDIVYIKNMHTLSKSTFKFNNIQFFLYYRISFLVRFKFYLILVPPFQHKEFYFPCKNLFHVYLLFQLMYQFMDKTKPLPDLPSFEPIRKSDPITIKFDHLNYRNDHYWRNQSYSELNDKIKQSFDVSKQFIPIYYFYNRFYL